MSKIDLFLFIFRITNCYLLFVIFKFFNLKMSSQKVSKGQQKRNRVAAKAEEEAIEKSRILRLIFRKIAEEAATKAVIVYARIASTKEVERKRKEKLEKERQKHKEARERFFNELDDYLSVLPEDKKKHTRYCNCDECSNLPSMRQYTLAFDSSQSSTNKKVYIFMLPETFYAGVSRLYDLAYFAIKHKYQLFDFRSYVKTKEEIKEFIDFGNEYEIIGLADGIVKPFDTYLNEDFWAGIKGCFIKPIEKIISKYYRSYRQEVRFGDKFYSIYSKTTDNDRCYHENSKMYEYSCPYNGKCDCTTRPNCK